VIHRDDLPRVQQWAFINSLRGWVACQMVGTAPAR
jgi:para-aminobenzoate synthetase/4-amino-4-deoxychorismate lyase